MTQIKLITFFMYDFAGGGVERMRIRIAAALAARGFAVHIVVVRRQGDLAQTIPPGVTVIDLAASRTLTAIPRLIRYFRTHRPYVCFSSLGHNNIVMAVSAILSGTGVHSVLCQHNALSHETCRSLKYRAIAPLYHLLAPYTARYVAVSSGIADELSRLCGIPEQKISRIYNPIVGPDFPERLAAPRPAALPSTASGPSFIFAGRLDAQKGPDIALRAFRIFRASSPGRLFILGDGPLRAQLEAEAKDCGLADDVIFTGFQQDVLPWLAAGSAVIVPSRYEGFSNIIVEALACGTQVGAADCDHGPAEILGGGAYGVVFEVENPAACAAAMHRALSHPIDPAVLRARAAEFSVERCVTAHETLIASLPARGTLFGLRFTQQTLPQIAATIATTQPSRLQSVVTPNIDHIRLLRLPGFRAACAAAAMVLADGWPVALAVRLLAQGHRGRLTGCDLTECLLKMPSLAARRVLIVTEAQQTTQAIRIWAARHPGAVTALTAPPGLLASQPACETLIARIRAAAPDILILTLGAPTSEVFLHRHADVLPPAWALCVGQAMRVHLGITQRAPRLLQFTGLEWLWRLAQEPQRLAGRYARAAVGFARLLLSGQFRRHGTLPG